MLVKCTSQHRLNSGYIKNRKSRNMRESRSQQERDFVVVIFGSRMNYAVPRVLESSGRLLRVYTDFYCGRKLNKVVSFLLLFSFPRPIKRMLQLVKSRRCSNVPDKRVESFYLIGILYLIKLRFAKCDSDIYKVYEWLSISLQKKIVTHEDCKYIYLVNGSSLGVIKNSIKKNIRVVLEQVIASKEKELEEIRLYDTGFQKRREFTDCERLYIENEKQEWRLADKIICASNYVLQSLDPSLSERIRVVPYGVGEVKSDEYISTLNMKRLNNEVFRLLFVGSVSRRKGVEMLIKIFSSLGEGFCLDVVGRLVEPNLIKDVQFEGLSFHGALPKQDVERFYQRANIFLFPSLCEGSATVVYEAANHGLPVITTPNSGSIIVSGENGFILSPDDLKGFSSQLLELKRNKKRYVELLDGMKNSRESFSYRAYESRLKSFFEECVDE